jgi:Tol biopolymer transport system component
MMHQVGRFWTWVSFVVVGNFLLIGLVLFLEARADLRPVEMAPADGSHGVSTRPVIEVRFRHPMDPTSLRASFHIDPAIEGTLDVQDNGLTFRPDRSLSPGTSYTVTIAAGVLDAAGRASVETARAAFQTRLSRLLVMRRTGSAWELWVVDPTTEEGHPLARAWTDADQHGTPPIVSPSADGDRVAYIVPADGPRWSLWIVDIASREAHPILHDQDGIVTDLSWSSRGDLIAYEQSLVLGTLVQRPKIWIVTTDGTQTALVYGRADESGSHPTWAPDGRQLAFYENRFRAIAISSFTGTLRSVRSSISQSAVWAPDGASLTYVERSSDHPGQLQIMVARLDASSLENQAQSEDDVADRSPAWSPDGQWLAFARLTQGGSGIWVRASTGGTARPLLQQPGWSQARPIWAPDGSALASSRVRLRAGSSEEEPEVWLARLDGPPRRLQRGGWLVGWLP